MTNSRVYAADAGEGGDLLITGGAVKWRDAGETVPRSEIDTSEVVEFPSSYQNVAHWMRRRMERKRPRLQ